MFADLAGALPWEKVTIFQVDERVAPDGDRDRNAGQLVALGGTHHLMPVTDHDLVAGAARYAAALPRRFDVVHLGMGDDGHTASWPPGDPVIDSTDPVALSLPYAGRVRMTLTPTVVNDAMARIVLVHGGAKAAALRDWLEGHRPVPIARLTPERTYVFADRAAASRLTPIRR
jgi:6-phosphogluconolactonase/glucosamine-6-phosphate isomerase/deaminase